MRKFKSLSKRARVISISLALIVGLILAVGIYFLLGAFLLFGRHYEPSFTISTSPDDRYELVVREWSCLGGGGADVYIRETEWYHHWNKKEIGTTSVDDGYQPFSHDTYYVEWQSDKVTVYYYGCYYIENRNDRSTWLGVLSYDLE